MISPLAQELNDILSGTVVDALLSELGRRMYFPRGIISQGGEASLHADKANGTIGMTVINGTPAELPTIKEIVPELTPREVVAYEKTAGNPEFRKAWKEQIIKKNPLLEGKVISTPIVVPGLTAAISYVADLFFVLRKTLPLDFKKYNTPLFSPTIDYFSSDDNLYHRHYKSPSERRKTTSIAIL